MSTGEVQAASREFASGIYSWMSCCKPLMEVDLCSSALLLQSLDLLIIPSVPRDS